MGLAHDSHDQSCRERQAHDNAICGKNDDGSLGQSAQLGFRFPRIIENLCIGSLGVPIGLEDFDELADEWAEDGEMSLQPLSSGAQ